MVYLDNSATTPPCEAARQALLKTLDENWGNPSSRHTLGVDADNLLEYSRSVVARKLMANHDEIVFTSGGTEANNLAVFGTAAARRKGRQIPRIVTCATEHPSVEESAKRLGDIGFEVVFLPVDKYGRVLESQLARAITPNTVLVSLMLVNNETGTFQPVKQVKRYIHAARSNALFHVDAVQAFGKIAVFPGEYDADLLTISAHKIHGVKGAGALYVRKGVTISPRVFGGGQEQKIRPGTENLPAIAAFAAAVEQLPDYREVEKITALRNRLVTGLHAIKAVINSPEDALPYIVNFSLLGQKSEVLLNFLSAREIYVSSGSACKKGLPSHVLKAMNLPQKTLDGAIRVSFSHTNTETDVDTLLVALEEAVTSLYGN